VQYYILTQSCHFKEVLYWLQDHNVTLDIHLNRTRFSIEPGTRLFTEFQLRWSTVCHAVDPTLDLATGLPLTSDEC
jgi:hypothetical protein